MKILFSAFACAPNMGSEYGRSWNLVTRLVRNNQVWVICTPKFRTEIENSIKQNPIPGLHFEYLDLPLFDWLIEKSSAVPFARPVISAIYYYLWQFALHFRATQLNQKIHFDIAQHISLMRYWMPSGFALLPVPFIWGTIGGAERVPPGLMKSLSWRGTLLEIIRQTAQDFASWDPLVRLTAQRSVVALTMTPRTTAQLKKLGTPSIVESAIQEIGIERQPNQPFPPLSVEPESQPIVRFISAGRMVEWKGYHLSLRAFARLANTHKNVEYLLMGDGIEQKNLRKLCQELGISGQVHFPGFIPRENILPLIQQCHVFVHPALHESGGTAVLEAMSLGLPVICLNMGGPAALLNNNNECGILVAPTQTQQVIEEMADAMLTMVDDPELRKKMGDAARARSEHFLWENLIETHEKIYKQVLARET